MKFSIIVVSLNPGDKLRTTLNSIRNQTFKDFEVIVKDGGSSDNSLSILSEFSDIPIRVEVSNDTGIYDAMNQAVSFSKGDYLYFLNCGDSLSSEVVLEKVISFDGKDIIYGNIFDDITKSVVISNPKIDGFACYRNVPCHQACFYKRKLVSEHPFNIEYKIRADYEQFLWCFFKAKASMQYIEETVAIYEGGGFSETKDNIRKSKIEHEEITQKYMTKMELFKYKMILLLTFAPLRTAISHNPLTAGIYNRFKGFIYKR